MALDVDDSVCLPARFSYPARWHLSREPVRVSWTQYSTHLFRLNDGKPNAKPFFLPPLLFPRFWTLGTHFSQMILSSSNDKPDNKRKMCVGRLAIVTAIRLLLQNPCKSRSNDVTDALTSLYISLLWRERRRPEPNTHIQAMNKWIKTKETAVAAAGWWHSALTLAAFIPHSRFFSCQWLGVCVYAYS